MIKNEKKKHRVESRWYPTQGTKGSRQVSEMGVLVPVKIQNWRSRSRSRGSKGNSDGWLAWPNA